MPGSLGHRQLALIEECEPSAYHDDGRSGYFALLWDDGGRKVQRSFPLESMHMALGAVDRSRDTWVSQAEFFARTRRLVHLKRISVCFADLDTYKVRPMASLSAEQQLRELLTYCNSEGVPEPSLVVFSGRGLQVKWVLDGPLPQQALPRWQSVQRELTRRLQPFGSDVASIDASRVLRLVHSTNTKSGQVVRILHNSTVRHQFDALASQVLPFRRDQLAFAARDRQLDLGNCGSEFGDDLETRAKRELRRSLRAANDAGAAFRGAQLAWDRLDDLRRLAAMRGWQSGAPDNWRDRAVFLGACFLAQAIPNIAKLDLEVRTLAKEFAPHWSERRVRDSTSAALLRAHATAQEARAKPRGARKDHRYKYKSATLVELLEITAAEQSRLKTIIHPAEAQRRDTERARRVRRAAGAMDRCEYLERAEHRRTEGLRLRAEGRTWSEVASEVGYASAKSAQVAVSRQKKGAE